MDLQMPRKDGIAAIGRLRKKHLDIAIVILTTFNSKSVTICGSGGRFLKFGVHHVVLYPRGPVTTPPNPLLDAPRQSLRLRR